MKTDDHYKQYRFPGDQRGRSAPQFRLSSGQGRPVALSDYRSRQNLVLFFPDGADRQALGEALTSFAERQKEYRADEATVLAIVHASPQETSALQERLDATFPVLLADPEGTIREKYAGLLPGELTNGEALLFVLDRFGAPHAAFVSDQPAAPELHEQIQSWLLGIELECPE